MTTSLTHSFDLDGWITGQLAVVEQALDQWVSVDASAHLEHHAPSELMAAMRYAVLDGGKRLRPLLVMAAFEAVQSGQSPAMSQAALRAEMSQAALRAACAVELI